MKGKLENSILFVKNVAFQNGYFRTRKRERERVCALGFANANASGRGLGPVLVLRVKSGHIARRGACICITEGR